MTERLPDMTPKLMFLDVNVLPKKKCKKEKKDTTNI
jgi:hypothetical protein